MMFHPLFRYFGSTAPSASGFYKWPFWLGGVAGDGSGAVVQLHFLPIQVTAGKLKCF